MVRLYSKKLRFYWRKVYFRGLPSRKIVFCNTIGCSAEFVQKRFVRLKLGRKHKQTSCLQRFLENSVGHLTFYNNKYVSKRVIKFNCKK